jgi:hypothetical protein
MRTPRARPGILPTNIDFPNGRAEFEPGSAASSREGALAQAGPRGSFVRIALALIALVATLLPDLRPYQRASLASDFLAAISEPASERERNPALSWVAFQEEPDEEADGDRLHPALAGGCQRPDGGLGRPSHVPTGSASGRRAAHQATGPPGGLIPRAA